MLLLGGCLRLLLTLLRGSSVLPAALSASRDGARRRTRSGITTNDLADHRAPGRPADAGARGRAGGRRRWFRCGLRRWRLGR